MELDKKQKVVEVGYRDILKQKSFMWYLIANIISRFGDSVDGIAYSWMVYELTGSAALMATLYGVNAIPNIIFLPIAGVFVDYRSKKKIQCVCSIGRGLIVTLTAVLFLSGNLEVYHLFVFTFINSTLESFQIPSATALVPLLLEKRYFTHGSALQGTTSRIAELIGMGSAGFIVALMGVSGALFIDAATFFICGGIIIFLKHQPEKLNKQPLNLTSYKKDLGEGFRYIYKHKIIWYICVFAAAINMFLVPFNTLNIPFVSGVLALGPAAISAMGISFTVGMLIGSAVFPKIKSRIKGINLFVGGGVLVGGWYFALLLAQVPTTGLMRYLVISIGCFVAGLSIALINMLVNVTFMEKVEQEYLGRVSGVMNAMAVCAMPLGAFIVGGMSSLISIQLIFIVSGVVIILIFMAQKFNKALQEL